MNDFSKKYWENIYSVKSLSNPACDDWLNKYMDKLRNVDTVIDLGCGNGGNALLLHNNNINVIACDFSEAALMQIEHKKTTIRTLCFDMVNGLPFEDEYADIIISDLSLHYFSWDTTQTIVEEVFRVLKNNGTLLCRVNSIKEHHPNINDKTIEPGYFFNGEDHKRFFAKGDIIELFSSYDVYYIEEGTTEKYGELKHLWEFAVRRKKNGEIKK